ncbi:Ribonuclease P/MRP protein subunit POP1 containing protein [Aphelenchoides bicaudatus]|nr:Ribonuclease P/MRP protein subunit POP1 containing protein [Aphelenchoides bicaudatus]
METQDVLNTDSVVPSFIDPSALVLKRLNQVSDLVDVIRHGGRDHNPKTSMQRLPKHMRRRAMSHNIKRLPRKYRMFAVKELAKRKARKKTPDRYVRRRPRNLQKEYAKRSNQGNRWLQTHIWHAKRFEMIKLWNFKVPLRCYQQGVRPFMKNARDNAVMFDDSYCRMLRFRFPTSTQLDIFKQNYSKLRNSECSSLKNGLRASCSGIQQICSFNNIAENATDVILFVHPLFFDKPLDLLKGLTGETFQELPAKSIVTKFLPEYGTDFPMNCYESTSCSVSDETNLYSTFTFYGSNVITRLFNCLTLVCNDELESDDLKEIHAQWKHFCQNRGSINTLPNGTSFTLLVEDPRLSSPIEAQKEECESSSSESFEHETTKKKLDLIFDRRVVRKYLAASISETKLNNLRSTRVGPINLKHYKVNPYTYFILELVHNKSCQTYITFKCSADFSFPTSTAVVSEVGALSDRFILCDELMDCAYPFAWLPLTLERPLYRWKRYHKFKEPVFESLGKWNSLQNWSHIIDNPKYLSRLQCFIKSKAVQSQALFEMDDVVIPVRVKPIGDGLLTDDGLIYHWVDESKTDAEMLDFNGTLSDEEDPDKFFDQTDSEDEDQKPTKKPASFFQERRSHTKSHPEDSQIIGRLTIAQQTHYHGGVEGLGYIDSKSFSKLCETGGKVRVRNPNSIKLVNACVKMLYSQ